MLLDEDELNEMREAYFILKKNITRLRKSRTQESLEISSDLIDTDEYLDYANENKWELNTVNRLTARNATYVGTILDNLFSSPVFYGSSKARNAVKGLVADCMRSTNIDGEIDQLFQNAYNNAI